ncbi:MAG: type II toxin-antitoxin system Phd/YefM family antitoxin [Calditrichaeota bacterium]|nr:type II toxin-antitoxin system Phd/YefM family antitoxin [Calditrichota bacterium]
MQLKDDIKPISYLKSHAAEIIKTINETHRPIIINQNGEAKGVFLDTESFETMRNALGLLKLFTQSEADIENGNTQPHDDVFSDLKNQLKSDKNK